MNSVQHQKGTECPPKTVTGIVTVKKIIEEDNKTIYAVIEHQLKIRSSAVKTIIHDHQHLKKVVSCFVPRRFSDCKNSKACENETLKLLNNGGCQIFSTTVAGDETYILFFDRLIREDSRVWIYEDEETPTITTMQ